MSQFLSVATVETSQMEIAVVVPTLNERENMAPLIHGILAADPRLQIVVVDDGSTDGTLDVVTRLAAESAREGQSRIHLLSRGRKLGYASAVQDGMRYALARGADRIVQMDADFSHHPSYLNALLGKSADYDLVIGSRYVRGGGTRNWGLHRRLLSRGANFLARTLLRLTQRDCTGGYRCWRAQTIRECGLLSLDVQGYAFLFLTLDRCREVNATVGEVPIIFADREFGQSKMNRQIIWEAAQVLFRLSRQRPVRQTATETPLAGETAPQRRAA